MMRKAASSRKTFSALPALLGLALVSPALLAQEPRQQEQSDPLDFSGAVAVGAEHNTNLSVAELESASGASDTAATLDANGDMSWRASDALTIASGYSYSGSRYQDLDGYDLDLHLLYADAAYDFPLLTLGANHYYADANLGGDNFLTLNQSSLYAGKLFAAEWYLRGALNFSDKEFDVFNARDAANDGFSVDVYRFFNGGRSNITLGYTDEDEDTRDAAFDYTADTLRLRVNHRFTFAAREARLQLGYRWQDRAYRSPTPVINAPRDDNQRVAEARLEVDVVENIAVTGGWEYGDYASRLPSADFTNNRISLAVEASFQASH